MVFVLAFDSQRNNILCGDTYTENYVNAHTIMQTGCICIHRNTMYEHAHKYSMHMSTTTYRYTGDRGDPILAGTVSSRRPVACTQI